MIRRALGCLIAAILLAIPLTGQAGSSGNQTQLYDLVEFQPTPFHETIYWMMQNCTGMQGDFWAVRWYTAKALVWESGDLRHEYLGMWFEGWGFPAIVLDKEHVFDGGVVGHEIMHDLYKGQAPMDTAQRCNLDWANLAPIVRPDSLTSND